MQQPAAQLVVGPRVHGRLVICKCVRAVAEGEHGLRVQIQVVAGTEAGKAPAVCRALQIQHGLGVTHGSCRCGPGLLGAGNGNRLGILVLGPEGEGHGPVVRVGLRCRHGLVQQIEIAAPVGALGIEYAVKVPVVVRGQREQGCRQLRGKIGLHQGLKVRQSREGHRGGGVGYSAVGRGGGMQSGHRVGLAVHPVIGLSVFRAAVRRIQRQRGQVKPVIDLGRGGVEVFHIRFSGGLRKGGRRRGVRRMGAAGQKGQQQTKKGGSLHGNTSLFNVSIAESSRGFMTIW